MIVTKPGYYDAFSCLAGACPDTCCGHWQVVIDPESLAFYESVGGALGERIRGAITVEDGEACFRLRDGKCQLLTSDGLCPIQRELGHDRLCRICASYPRFSTEIGMRRELGLSLSCPEAARLILTAEAPLTLCVEESSEPMTDLHELSPELILALRALRSRALGIAGDRSLPFSDRCVRLLRQCAPVAAAARARRDRALENALAEGELCGPVSPASAAGTARFFLALREALESLEALQPEFRARLLCSLEVPAEGPWPNLGPLWEQLLCYGVYKYFPRAAFDRAVWPAAVFCVALPLLLRQLIASEGPADVLRLCWRLSRELEHSEENMAALLRAFSRRPFRPAALTSVLAAIPG